MGKHLKTENWFIKQSTGTMKMKRVSAKAEQQFPRVYRSSYQQYGLPGLIRLVQNNFQCGLGEAWARVKMMFNGG